MRNALDDKPASPPGRPKGPGPITSRIQVVASPPYKRWVADLAIKLGLPEQSDLVRLALRRLAESERFVPPPPR